MATRSIPLVPFPASLMPAKTAADAMRSLAAIALNEELPLAAADCSGMERKSVFIPPGLESKIQKRADEMGWGFQETIGALCGAGIDFVARQRESFLVQRDFETVDFPARAGQDVYYKSLMASISRGRVCLAEASTGSGKSRAMIAAAIKASQQGKRPVVVAAPTLAILGGSLWSEFEELKGKHGLGRTAKAMFFPGATEFVDYDKLREHLDSLEEVGEEDDPAVRQWVDAGGPLLNDTPLSRAMKGDGRSLHWLMSDLRSIATNIDPEEFVCESPKNSIRELIDAVRAEAAEADIIFCTHAMLAMAQRSNWERLPKPNVLIVDEAHMLEPIFSNIHSGRLSLYSFRHAVRVARKASGKGRSSALGKIEAATSELIANARYLDSGIGGAARVMPGQSLPAVLRACIKMRDAMRAKGLSSIEKIEPARKVIDQLIQLIEGGAKSEFAYGQIEFSPDRRFPSILVGQKSIAGLLGALWKAAEGGVVLASATLAIPDEFGNAKFDYISGVLALPASRVDAPAPLVAPWVTSVPILHIPKDPALLCRPMSAERTDESEAAWLGALSKAIVGVAEAALGGTMVLMTSYAQIEVLDERLRQAGLAERLITMRPAEKFAVFEARYREAHRRGVCPVFLAVGVAWTGVDLVDKSAAPGKDTLLSDLIIGCLPIGMNRTSTMTARIGVMGVNPIIKEAVMVFRQGLGRSVRTESALNKNIWVMDGRIWASWSGMRILQLSIKRLLEKYPKRVSF